ncbi:MAG: MaoC/PaaZ C-terminal domain-containing protein [Acidimicrobiales bacterium]
MITESFDDIAVGAVVTTPGRTVTETDVVSFCYLTGNWLEIHSNREFAAGTEYGQRLVQGSLTFSLIAGLVKWDPQYLVAFYGVDNLRFIRPVFINDTIHATIEVVEKTELDGDRGVVANRVTVFNQRDEPVQSSIFKLLVRKSPLGPGAGSAQNLASA